MWRRSSGKMNTHNKVPLSAPDADWLETAETG